MPTIDATTYARILQGQYVPLGVTTGPHGGKYVPAHFLRPSGGIIGNRVDPEQLARADAAREFGMAVARRGGPVRGPDWNEEQLAIQREQDARLLPIIADMEKSRERNALEAALASDRLSASWAEGGRDLEFRAGESAADRQFRNFLQAQEFGYRGRESAADRQHDIRRLSVADQQARERLGIEHQYGLENTAIQQDFTGEQNLLNRLQMERMARMGHGMDLERLGVSHGYQSERDRDLAQLELDHLAVANRYARQNMFDQQGFQSERDWWQADQTRQRDDRLFNQQMQEFDRQSARYDAKEHGAFVLDDAKAAKTALLRMIPMLDDAGRRKAEELLQQHAGILKQGLRSGQLPQAMTKWLSEISEAQLEERIQPEPPPSDLYQRNTFLDPDTGVRMQPDGKGGFAPVQNMPSSPDTMSGGKPMSEVERFWSPDPKASTRDTHIKAVMDEWKTYHPDQPMPFETAVREGLKRAKLIDKMQADREKELFEEKAAPVRGVLKELAEAEIDGRQTDVAQYLPQVKEYAEANGLDIEKLYEDEMLKAGERMADTGHAKDMKLPKTLDIEIGSEPVDYSRDPLRATMQEAGVKKFKAVERSERAWLPDGTSIDVQGVVPIAQSEEEAKKFRAVLEDGTPFIVMDETGWGYDVGKAPRRKPQEAAPAPRKPVDMTNVDDVESMRWYGGATQSGRGPYSPKPGRTVADVMRDLEQRSGI